jgi:dihydroorotase-like cyclic amidohydrolase
LALGATQFKCCPPIRETENREALWSALRDGVIDYVVSDHSPCTADLKVRHFFLLIHAGSVGYISETVVPVDKEGIYWGAHTQNGKTINDRQATSTSHFFAFVL